MRKIWLFISTILLSLSLMSCAQPTPCIHSHTEIGVMYYNVRCVAYEYEWSGHSETEYCATYSTTPIYGPISVCDKWGKSQNGN